MAAVGTQFRSSNSGMSRLALMQARLREQLMIEKESKLLEMAAQQQAEREDTIQRVTRSNMSSLSSSLSSLSSTGPGQGKVRKMFEDRRLNGTRNFVHGSPKGYDKSYPLEPVSRSYVGKPPARGPLRQNRTVSMERNGYRGDESRMTRSKSQVNVQKVSRTDPRGFGQGIMRNGPSLHHYRSASSLVDSNGFPATPPSSRFAPKGQRSPSPPPPKRTSEKKPPNLNLRKPSFQRPAARRDDNFLSPDTEFQRNGVTPPSSRTFTEKNTAEGLSTLKRRGPTPPGLASCQICGRNFAPDRVEKHEVICSKSKQKEKKKKIFDPVKMRTKGTEAEKFVVRGDHLKEQTKAKKSDWRKKHEQFIQTVRAAKGVPGYEAPAMDTSDYEQCPHCGRKFSGAAAERHIPKCANITSNKPSQRRMR